MPRAVTAIFILACAVFIHNTVGSEDATTSSSSSDAEWTYRRTATDGEEPYGPSDWYKGYPDCAGDSQSPINLAANTQTITKSKDFKVEFFPHVCMSDELVFEANEHVWEVFFDGCSEEAHLRFDGERYNLYQIHIHSPSEHAIGGSLRAAEMHLVHIKEGTDDEYLVVGVLFDVSEYGYNVELQQLWKVLDIGVTTSTDEPFEMRVYDILPPNPIFSHYTGSLTTPPCTEGVTWIVMTEPVIIGKLELDEFRESVATYDDSKVNEFGDTNRPYQPLNDRHVYLVKV